MYIRKVFVLFIISILTLSSGLSKETRIYGTSPEYKKKEFVFYTFNEPVLMEKLVLCSVVADNNGHFDITFEQNKTSEIYVEIGKYKGILITEPGNDYEIKLPPFTEISEFEERSVYFKRKPYWLGLPGKNDSDLNFQVRSFIKEYNLKIDENFSSIYKFASKDVADSIKSELNKKYPDSGNNFFNAVKLYSFAELDLLVNKNMTDVVINKYFAKNPILNDNTKYQEIFRVIFTNFLSKKASSIKGNQIYSLVNQGRFSELVSFFTKLGYNKELAEITVLKGLHDAYYSKDFVKEGVLDALRNAESKASNTSNRLLSAKITKKLTHISVGKNAPSFILPDINGEEVTLKSYEGRYIYLSFVHTDSPDCKKELNLLKNLQQRYNEVLDIVTISLDKKFNDTKVYWKKQNLRWTVLNGAIDKSVAESYSVKSTPSFYLIAPNGTFLLSPAPPVSRGFETEFVRAFRNHENLKKRNQHLNK
jgi:peroxiredoxin